MYVTFNQDTLDWVAAQMGGRAAKRQRKAAKRPKPNYAKHRAELLARCRGEAA